MPLIITNHCSFIQTCHLPTTKNPSFQELLKSPSSPYGEESLILVNIQVMLFQINQHPNLSLTQVIHPKTTTPTSLMTPLVLLTPQIPHPKCHQFIHQPSMIIQTTQLSWPNKTTSPSPSPTNFHNHLNHHYQMILLRNILNSHKKTITTQQLHHHHPTNMKSLLKSSKKLMSLMLFLRCTLLNAIWINNLPPPTHHHQTTWSILKTMSTIAFVAPTSKNKTLSSKNISLGLSIYSLRRLQIHHHQTLHIPHHPTTKTNHHASHLLNKNTSPFVF